MDAGNAVVADDACVGAPERGPASAEKREPNPVALLLAWSEENRGRYALSVLLAVIGVAGSIVPYVAAGQMIVGVLGGVRDFGFYLMWCGVAAAGYAGYIVCHHASTAVSHKATFSTISKVRRRIADKLTRVPLGYVLDTPSGKLKNIMVEKVDSIETTLAHVVPEMTANLLVPLGIIAVIFALDWRMGLASLVTIPIGMLCYAVEMRDYAEKYGRVVAAKNHMGATIVEYIGGIEVIKAFGRSASSYAKFTDAVKANSGLMMDWSRTTLPWTAIMMSVWPSVLLGVLPVGCFLFMDGSLSAATFITVIVLSLGIIGPLFSAIMFTDDIAKISTIVGEIGTVLDQPEMNRPTRPCPVRGSRIELDDVTFSYGDVPVLKGVTLSIAPGSMVALVGPSGSGKSTVAKLIASQWEAAGGAVRIGGSDVRDMPLSQVADAIAYVAQDNYLFDDTVMENIRMGRPDATDEEVTACAKASGCHEFITALEHGYQTVVGGAGGHLSGGERQRIAIARAMMKDAPIVILDEATANVDPENERDLQRAIAELTRSKTVIMIAHRLKTVRDADQIVVLDGGRIGQRGTHDALMAEGGLYADFVGMRERAIGWKLGGAATCANAPA